MAMQAKYVAQQVFFSSNFCGKNGAPGVPGGEGIFAGHACGRDVRQPATNLVPYIRPAAAYQKPDPDLYDATVRALTVMAQTSETKK